MNKILTIFILILLLACSGEYAQVTDSKKKMHTTKIGINTSILAVDYVWPWLDSANSRWFYFNTATRPFGLVNLSPDTELGGAWGSGYRYHSLEIKGFNHIHAWQLSGLSVLRYLPSKP
ncbi:hypothetical protein L0668_16850 [Paraglaciecola aquimarina]|uniref:Glycosyl hydrolase family 92 N-terminal domain-containing protein n=1 Tax=Paraglaciecola algarum TaxID=3050085 RepID=A0ABS9DA15_9ALTE|nr:hypothetical protein [Paraglaciecola sp. G1-23]MCF2949790.1 hypothetical protein [Paraglaciecola sp. G1-23]